jgi:uncharacterized membrane protein YeaQ/YmgE (transglycosylase-associated protein family)
MSFFFFLAIGITVGAVKYFLKIPNNNTLLQYTIVGILGSFLSSWAITVLNFSALHWISYVFLALLGAAGAVKAFEIREKKKLD